MMIIVDVREPEEFEAEHIEGAVNIPLSVLEEKSPAFFEENPGSEIVAMCRSGARSEKAMHYWIDHHLVDEDLITNYRGGMLRWVQEGNETVKPVLQ